MTNSRFTGAQVTGMLKEEETGTQKAKQYCKHCLGPATHSKLQRLVVDVMLDNVVLNDPLGNP